VRAHETYGFGFHQLTTRYTVVHVPCYLNKSGTFDAVQVYTLGGSGGDASWREVPTPGASVGGASRAASSAARRTFF
jgi:hypothetical protein